MKEMVILTGIIIGGDQRIECKIRATKTTLDGEPSFPPVFTQYRIMESNQTARMTDGDYEVIVNGEQIRVVRANGQFLAR